MHAQEEAAGLLVAELLGVEDVAALAEQQAGHAVDDAGTVRAGKGEDVVVAHRRAMVCERRPLRAAVAAVTAGSAQANRPRTPCGSQRRYCGGPFTFAPSSAAACQGQRGS